MVNYREKYFKYKNKYLIKKNQKGGVEDKVEIDLDILKNEISENIKNVYDNNNYGLRNCGIFFIDKYAIKCLSLNEDNNDLNREDKLKKIIYINKINKELSGLVPKYYKWPDGNIYNLIETNDENKKYAIVEIMDKMDGDLTDYVLKKSYINAYGNLDNYDFYYNRLPKVQGYCINKHEDSQENIQKFNQIKEHLTKYIFEICYSLNNQIIFLHHELLKRGWVYRDLKLDNIGYKIENSKIKLFFIDIESGLVNIFDQHTSFRSLNSDEYLDFHFINSHLGEYSLLGQYSFYNIFKIDFENFKPVFDEKKIIDELEKNNFLINKKYTFFNWIQFRHTRFDGFFVIQFIQGFYRLVLFDDVGNHMSNPEYNPHYEKVDELYYSTYGVFKKINNICHYTSEYDY